MTHTLWRDLPEEARDAVIVNVTYRAAEAVIDAQERAAFIAPAERTRIAVEAAIEHAVDLGLIAVVDDETLRRRTERFLPVNRVADGYDPDNDPEGTPYEASPR